MSTSEKEAGQLTRKQMRERLLTDAAAESPVAAPVYPVASPPQVAPVAPLPRAVELTVVPEAPQATTAEATSSRRTRRQVREEERVRTASVPLAQNSTPAAAGVPSFGGPAESVPPSTTSYTPATPSPTAYRAPETYVPPVVAPAHQAPTTPQVTPRVEPRYVAPALPPVQEQVTYAAPAPTPPAAWQRPAEPTPIREEPTLSTPAAPVTRPTPSHEEQFGQVEDSGGSSSSSSALIMSQQPGVASLAGPIAGTGEILMTGSYDLPSGLGSNGYAPGTTDGKEADLVLIDGELAPTSSPTPIAASSAISTIKPAGEVIRPPEPDKGNRLMLALTITAGTLALALVGVVVVAITTGALN